MLNKLIYAFLTIFLLITPVYAQLGQTGATAGGGGGGSSTAIPDTVGTPVVFSSGTGSAIVSMNGQRSAFVSTNSGNLVANIQAMYSDDGGINYRQTYFLLDGIPYGLITGIDIDAQPVSYGIYLPQGATHARVKVNTYTSGSATITLRATTTGADSYTYTRNGISGVLNTLNTFINNDGAPGAGLVGALTGIANVAQPTWIEGNGVLASMDLHGNQRMIIEDALGNNRGVAVNASNQLSVNVGNASLTVGQATGTNLHMVCDSGCSSSTAPADNSAFTAGTTSSSPVSGFYHATRDSLTDGRIGAIALNVNRAVLVQLEDASKNGITSTGNALDVNLKTSSITLTISGTVTANAGTNLNTSLLALEAGGNLATLAGVVTSARAAVNPISGQAGVQGASGVVTALTQRVVLATDVALPTGTNVIGHVIADSGSTTAVTGNVTVTQATGTNLHAVLDTTSTTAVTQATGTNLHAVIDTGSTTAVTGNVTVVQTTGTNLHAVLDTTSTTAVTQATASNLNALVTQGTAAAGSSAWPITVTNTSDTVVKPGDSVNNAIRVNMVAGGTTGSTYGAPFPATGSAAGMKDQYGNMSATVVDASGAQLVHIVAIDPSVGASKGGQISNIVNKTRLSGPLGNPVGTDGDRLKVSLPIGDPCTGLAGQDQEAPVSQTATTKIVSGRPGLRIYICQIRIVVGAAEITSEWEGTGTNCGTGTIAHSGSTTAANGESFAANGGYQSGHGNGSVAVTIAGNDFCIAQSTSSRVSGKVQYIYAP